MCTFRRGTKMLEIHKEIANLWLCTKTHKESIYCTLVNLASRDITKSPDWEVKNNNNKGCEVPQYLAYLLGWNGLIIIWEFKDWNFKKYSLTHLMSKTKLFLWKMLSQHGLNSTPSLWSPWITQFPNASYKEMRKIMSVCLQHVHILTLMSFNNTCWLKGFLCLLKKLTVLCHTAQPARCFLRVEGTAAFFWTIRHQSPAGAWTGWAILTSLLPQDMLLHSLVQSNAASLCYCPHASQFHCPGLELEWWTWSIWPSQIRGFWLACLHATSRSKLPTRLEEGS